MSSKPVTTSAAEPPQSMPLKQGTTTCGFRLPKRRRSSSLEPGKFLRRLRAKLKWATRIGPNAKPRGSCSKVSSASSVPVTLARSRSCADPITDNSHRAQAVEDCIQFFNSSSLQTLNSVSS